MKLSTSFLMIVNEEEKIKEIDKYTDLMHFDIMDGKFTENKTDLEALMTIGKYVKKPKDVHLMVQNVKEYIDVVSKIEPEFITFHLEVMQEEFIDYVKSKGTKVGIALNPATDVQDLIPYLDKIDLVLVMSVKAGKGGQEFIDISEKLEFLDNYRKENKLNYLLEVDGGINPKVMNKVKKADIIVVGSFITNGDIKKQIDKINGFTLAELMGVIVILGILAIIVASAVQKNIINSRYKTCVTQEKNLIEAAKMLTTDNASRLPTIAGNNTIVTVGELVDGNYLDKDLENPMTKTAYNRNDMIEISITSTLDDGEVINNKDYTYTVKYNNASDACHK